MKKGMKLILVILWMGVIFFFSECSGDTSSLQSSKIVIKIIELLNLNLNTNQINTLTLIVRKLAHITEYFILCIFVSNYLKCYNLSSKKLLIYSFIICYLYACSDEVHQIFSKDRGPSFIDTLIDSIGIIIWLIILRIKYKMKGIKE